MCLLKETRTYFSKNGGTLPSHVEENLKAGGKKLLVENGQIIKIAKDKDGVTSREVLTKKWTDWMAIQNCVLRARAR